MDKNVNQEVKIKLYLLKLLIKNLNKLNSLMNKF